MSTALSVLWWPNCRRPSVHCRCPAEYLFFYKVYKLLRLSNPLKLQALLLFENRKHGQTFVVCLLRVNILWNLKIPRVDTVFCTLARLERVGNLIIFSFLIKIFWKWFYNKSWIIHLSVTNINCFQKKRC